MKATVTCDDVFDVLTRGPFPTGSNDDEAVEMHLAGCHECRQLAEALRPAVELIHEALEEAPSGLPEYRGRFAKMLDVSLPPPQRVWWEEEQLLELPLRPQPKASRSAWGMQAETAASLVRFASAALLGVALCLFVWTCSSLVGRQPAQWRSRQMATYSAGPLRLGPRTSIALAALNMPEICQKENKPADDTANNSHSSKTAADQACCTRCHAAAHPRGEQCQAAWNTSCEECHHAGKPLRLATQHVSLTQQTCQVCHDG